MGEKCSDKFWARIRLPRNSRNLLHVQICDMGQTAYFPSEGRRAEDFFALKNPMASAGFEPANLGTRGQHAASRPPKPFCSYYRDRNTKLHFNNFYSSPNFVKTK